MDSNNNKIIPFCKSNQSEMLLYYPPEMQWSLAHGWNVPLWLHAQCITITVLLMPVLKLIEWTSSTRYSGSSCDSYVFNPSETWCYHWDVQFLNKKVLKIPSDCEIYTQKRWTKGQILCTWYFDIVHSLLVLGTLQELGLLSISLLKFSVTTFCQKKLSTHAVSTCYCKCPCLNIFFLVLFALIE